MIYFPDSNSNLQTQFHSDESKAFAPPPPQKKAQPPVSSLLSLKPTVNSPLYPAGRLKGWGWYVAAEPKDII